jgi:type IX secretion system PorP/SprF family membrane protein
LKKFKMKIQILTTAFMMLAIINQIKAQTDPHFTQNYTYPMYTNPALTGSSDGDYRVSAIYRSQWGQIGNPYRTSGLSFDTRTNKNVAVGINLMNQSAGDGGFNYFNAYASIAYTGVKFGSDQNQRLIFAMQAGIINRSVDQSKFQWGEQWNPITGYNAAHATSESFATTSSTTLDLGTGVLYYDASPEKNANLFGGLSFFHINKPKDPIVSTQNVELNTMPLRYVIHGGINLRIFEGASIVPHFLFMQQGTAKETMLGTYIRKTVNEQTDIMFGGYYRHNDAIAPFIGVDHNSLMMAFSYDVNTSKLGSMSRNINSFEISFSYIMRKATKSSFDFNPCPRL